MAYTPGCMRPYTPRAARFRMVEGPKPSSVAWPTENTPCWRAASVASITSLSDTPPALQITPPITTPLTFGVGGDRLCA